MTVSNPPLPSPATTTTATTAAATAGTAVAATVGPPPPFDPELAAALEPIAKFLTPSITPEMLPTLRAASAAPSVPDEELHRGGAFTVQELSVPGPTGAPEVGLLVCRPTAAGTPVAVVYHIHGGGMIMGDNRSGVTEILDWAEALHLVVVSVEYRLAPEHPHPAPVEDCYAGLLWTAAHVGELGVDSGRVVLAGTSAGGGLAAATALLARDRGGPALAGQLLMCPMLDDRGGTASTAQMAGLGVWDGTSNRTGWTALLGDDTGGPDVSPYAAPARAGDLAGLPPAFVDVGSAETFRDEDIDYASRLLRAGVQTELHVWPGGFHGFTLFAPQARLSQECAAARLNWLRRLLTAA